MKKIVSMFLTGAILFTPSFAAFSDVPSNHWAYSSISKMEQSGILSGYSDGTFKPSNNITLAEFATIFTKIFNIPKNNTSNYFVDVNNSHWAKGYIEAVREYINPLYDSIGEYLGVTDFSYLKGLPGDIEMTREAFIYAVSRINGYDENLYVEGEEKTLFADYDEILYPKETVLAYKNKIISGEVVNGKTSIRPNRCITRAEASAIFRNLLKYEETRVTNKNAEAELNAVFIGLVKDIKENGIDVLKDKIYDTQDVLQNPKFRLDEESEKELKDISDKFFDKFKYEIIDRGFYSFNRGYVKIKSKGYNLDEQIKTIREEDIDIGEKLKEINKNIKDRKIKEIEKERIIDFAKKDGEWKLILR